MKDKKNLLYVAENYTHFSLCCDGEILNDNFEDLTLGSQFGLICPKCKKPLTIEEYKEGKLQDTDTRKRRVDGVLLTNTSYPEDFLVYSMEHKRCNHKDG